MRSITFVLLAVAVTVALLPAPPTDASTHKGHKASRAVKPTRFQRVRDAASRMIGHGAKATVVLGEALKLGKTVDGALKWYKQELASCNVHNHPKTLSLTDGTTIACEDIINGHAIVTVDLGKMNVLEKRIAADTKSLNDLKIAYGLGAANVATRRGSRQGSGGGTGQTPPTGQAPGTTVDDTDTGDDDTDTGDDDTTTDDTTTDGDDDDDGSQ